MLGQLVLCRAENSAHLNFRGAAIVKGARVGSNYFPFAGDGRGIEDSLYLPLLPLLSGHA